MAVGCVRVVEAPRDGSRWQDVHHPVEGHFCPGRVSNRLLRPGPVTWRDLRPWPPLLRPLRHRVPLRPAFHSNTKRRPAPGTAMAHGRPRGGTRSTLCEFPARGPGWLRPGTDIAVLQVPGRSTGLLNAMPGQSRQDRTVPEAAAIPAERRGC